MPVLPLPLFRLLLKLSGRRKRFESTDGLRKAVHLDRMAVDPAPSAALTAGLTMRKDTVQGRDCYVIAPYQPTARTRLLYLHGGAHVAEMSAQHWNLVTELVRATGCPAHVPIYPLAPESGHTQALAMLEEVYSSLEPVAAAGDLVLMGDSSGGGLALALAQRMVATGRPAPRDMVLISPWLDLTMAHARSTSTKIRDPWLDLPGLTQAALWWAQGQNLSLPQLSPLNGPLRGLGRITVLIGGQDLFVGECRALVHNAALEAVPVRFIEEPDMIHVWPLLPLARARPARAMLANIVRGELNESR
ncbi:alpha/beta hydrolase [Ramlibacter solisilvae]|uniref:alpha/beta hydrolase fold domain-containing protein n=1 Tax=Ramlibacter tataouinensis TaxID=94132 RepID=UPI0007775FD1|nr:alpha/beta hydrolase [Ramlibacter tataouinensis]